MAHNLIMKPRGLLRTTALSAMAVAIASMAVPYEAIAQHRGHATERSARQHGDHRADQRGARTHRSHGMEGQYRNRHQGAVREGRRHHNRQERRATNRNHRQGWRDGARVTRRGNHHRWNRGWRRSSRYNWRQHRARHRHAYNLGRYHAPYRHYHYRRLGIGFYLDSLFFGSRYWITNPWYYRLPPAYGPYRWVRYYDDALLVNIYTGEVADVIYDFFW